LIRSAVGCPAGVDLIKEFQRRGVTVIGMDCSPFSAGLFAADKGYVVPRGDSPEFLSVLKNIINDERPQGILTGPEEEIIMISRHKAELESLGVIAFVPDLEVTKIFTDKQETKKFFESAALPTAKGFRLDEIKAADFPLFIKPRKGRGGTGAKKLSRLTELEEAISGIDGPLVEKHLDGTEYTIDVLNDLEGKNLSIVPRVRLEVDSGISTKGITVNDKEIIGLVGKLMGKTRIPGPCCVQGFRTGDGFFFTEVNLRLGGGSMLAAKADPSFIENIISMLKGEKPRKSEGFRAGLLMLRHHENVFVDVGDNAFSGEMDALLKKRGIGWKQ